MCAAYAENYRLLPGSRCELESTEDCDDDSSSAIPGTWPAARCARRSVCRGHRSWGSPVRNRQCGGRILAHHRRGRVRTHHTGRLGLRTDRRLLDRAVRWPGTQRRQRCRLGQGPAIRRLGHRRAGRGEGHRCPRRLRGVVPGSRQRCLDRLRRRAGPSSDRRHVLPGPSPCHRRRSSGGECHPYRTPQ